jgi:hypothetical protein
MKRRPNARLIQVQVTDELPFNDSERLMPSWASILTQSCPLTAPSPSEPFDEMKREYMMIALATPDPSPDRALPNIQDQARILEFSVPM